MRTLIRCVSVSVLLIGAASVAGAQTCEWEWTNPIPPRIDIYRLKYETGLFVGVGRDGTIIRSSDGYSWMRPKNSADGDLYGIDWGAGRWVAVGEDVILTSTAALDWSPALSVPGAVFRDVEFSVSRFVAVGDGLAGQVATSVLGTDWELVEAPWEGAADSITGSDNGFYVAVGTEIWFSPDGFNWDEREPVPTSKAFSDRGTAAKKVGGDLFELDRIDLAFTGTKLFWAGGSELWATPLEGKWSLTAHLDGCSPWEDWLGLGAGPGWIVASGIAGCPTPYLDPTVTIIISVDGGDTFRPEWQGGLGGFPALARFGSRWVAAGALGDVIVSTDAATWDCDGLSCTSLACADGFVDLAEDDSGWIAVGGVGLCDDLMKRRSGAIVATSNDGDDWDVLALSGDRFRGVAATASGYLAVGDGLISRSPDGETWTDEASPDDAFLFDATAGDGWVVLVGQNGALYVSQDETTWLKVFLYLDQDLDRAIYDGDRFLVLGREGVVLRSLDGSNWSRMLVSSDADLKGAARGLDGWIAVGEEGTVLASANGEVWLGRRSGVDSHLRDVAWGNGRFVAVGWDDASDGTHPGVVLASGDGVHWTRFDAPGEGLRRVRWTGGSWITAGGDRTLMRTECLGTLIAPEQELVQLRVGETVELAIELSEEVSSDTTLSLSSSRPGRVSVPEAVTVTAQTSTVSVPVTGLGVVDGAVVTMELPQQLGGGSTTILASVQPPQWTPRMPGGRVTP